MEAEERKRMARPCWTGDGVGCKSGRDTFRRRRSEGKRRGWGRAVRVIGRCRLCKSLVYDLCNTVTKLMTTYVIVTN